MRLRYILLIIIVSFLSNFSQQATAQLSTNNWYVGNTSAGEWIQFKKVWLSEGHYRFTTKAVAAKKSQTVHLELNGQALQNGIEIPTNESGTFDLAHLGHKQLATGYYDIKLVFETGNVNCDMIFIRKDNSTSSAVLANDTQFSINRTDGMHIAPIGGAWGASSYLAKGGNRGDDAVWSDNNNQPFTREQVVSWNKQQIYVNTPPVTDQALDMYVSEQVESKVDFIFSHGRGETDSINAIEDRLYTPGVGAFGCRQLKKLVDAINRNAYAKNNLKIAYFIDNAVWPLAVEKHLGKKMSWGDPACQQFIWDYSFKNFYQTIPRDMLFERSPGVVPIQLWHATANYDYSVGDTKILEFLEFIKKKMISTFGLTPSFILAKSFFTKDPRTKDIAEGVQAWFSWGKEIISYETLHNKSYGFALNGGRYSIRNVWLNDWNPATNTGTRINNQSDYHQSSLKSDGTPVIRSIYEYGAQNSLEWLVLESWFDWREGSTWYRSDHPEYSFPNQYIALNREFADRNSESIVLEAEACDEFKDFTPGNSGGAYRVGWYNDLKKDFYSANMEVNLDIYRPLHQLVNFQNGGTVNPSFDNFSAGFNDVWGFDADGNIFCQEIDGNPVNWLKISKELKSVKKLALGRYYAWGLTTDNKVMKTELPIGWATNNCTGWSDITGSKPMKDIDLNMSTAWGIDVDGKVYYRDLAAKRDWVTVPGKLSTITADDEFIWGFAGNNKLVRMSVQSKTNWDTIANPHQLTKIEAGATEVWGVNAKNEVYRINSSGEGLWQLVATGYINVSVGYEYAWLADDSGNLFKYDLKGFENFTSFASGQAVDFPSSAKPLQQQITIQAWPNPFSNSLNISIDAENDDQAEISIFDLSGRRLKSGSFQVVEGPNSIRLDNTGSLKAGVYLLVVTVNEKQERVKIVKID